MQATVYRTLLEADDEVKISMGPVCFSGSPLEAACESDQPLQVIQNALHLLYFALNGFKIYSDQPITPLSSFFPKSGNSGPLEPLDVTQLNSPLFHALTEVLKASVEENEEKATALRMIQAIKHINTSYDPEKIEDPSFLSPEEWKSYVLLGTGFESLFALNPAFPSADLRQQLRPLLDIKYSHPVELLWKWIDQFYQARSDVLKGILPAEPFFLANPPLKISHSRLAEKLLVYSILATLLKKYPTEDSQSFDILPERVLAYFWTLETIEKKMTLLEGQEEMVMLNKIKTMHHALEHA